MPFDLGSQELNEANLLRAIFNPIDESNNDTYGNQENNVIKLSDYQK